LDAHDNVENGSVADRGQRPRRLRATHNHSVAPTEGPKHGERCGSGETESRDKHAASLSLLSLLRLGVTENCGPVARVACSSRICVIEQLLDV
jgi:hypothetical protein